MRKGTVLALSIILGVALLPAAVAGQSDHAFVGSQNCRKCHIKQYKSWEETAMAKAFESLKPGVKVEEKKAAGLDPAKDYTTDSSCVGCHVTGMGQEGGFVSEAETPDLLGVGCEACHGAGGTYVQDEYMSLKNREYKLSELVGLGLVEKVGKEQCVTCHNPDNPFQEGELDYEAIADQGMHEHFPLKYAHD